jgi:hypothetical protein
MSLLRRLVHVRVPDDLPIVCGLLTALLISAYLLAPVIAESTLGRPSSTLAVGFVVGPIIGCLAGAVALLIAMGLRWMARRAGVASVTMPPWLLGFVLLGTVAFISVLAVNARTQTIEKEFARRPHVIVESNRLVVSDHRPTGADARVEARLLFSVYGEPLEARSIEWNGRSVSVAGSDEQVTVLDSAGARIASTDLHAFDYIGRIRAVPFCRHPNGDRDLAVIVTLRATSSRSMLVLYGPDGALIYQNHLARTGGADTMYVGSRDGSEILVVEHGPVSVWTCSGLEKG